MKIKSPLMDKVSSQKPLISYLDSDYIPFYVIKGQSSFTGLGKETITNKLFFDMDSIKNYSFQSTCPNSIKKIISRFSSPIQRAISRKINFKGDQNFKYIVNSSCISKVFVGDYKSIKKDDDPSFYNNARIKDDLCIYLAFKTKDVFLYKDVIDRYKKSFYRVLERLKEENSDQRIIQILYNRLEEFFNEATYDYDIKNIFLHNSDIIIPKEDFYNNIEQHLYDYILNNSDVFMRNNLFTIMVNNNSVYFPSKDNISYFISPFLVVNKDFYERKESKSLFRRVIKELKEKCDIVYLSSIDIYKNNNKKLYPYLNSEDSFKDILSELQEKNTNEGLSEVANFSIHQNNYLFSRIL